MRLPKIGSNQRYFFILGVSIQNERSRLFAFCANGSDAKGWYPYKRAGKKQMSPAYLPKEVVNPVQNGSNNSGHLFLHE